MIKTIYHYTTIQTLYHILRSCNSKTVELHLHNVNAMNDKYEGFSGLKVADSFFKKEKHRDQYENLHTYFEEIKKVYQPKQRFYSDVYPICRDIYSMGFSAAKDSLSQWRAYGDDSKGVMIGFDYKIIKKHAPIEKDARLRFGQVDYVKTDKPRMRDEEKFQKFCDKYLSERNDSSCNDKWYLQGAFCFFKDYAFAPEKEYRLLYNYSEKDTDLVYDFKFMEQQICPYIKIKLPVNCITSIMLGSKPHCKQSEIRSGPQKLDHMLR